MEELKKCPFCGESPKLEHDVESRGKDKPGEIMIHWKVRCPKCKCSRDTLSNFSYYDVDDNGQLICKDTEDARLEVIKDWNTRA